MPVKLTAARIEEFELKEVDEEYGIEGDPTIISVRQATQREHEKRAVVFNRITRNYKDIGDGVIREIQEIPWTELARKEVFLGLAGCNILDENSKPLFRFADNRLDMDENEFINAWGKLPSTICRAIHKRILEVNFTWDPNPSDAEIERVKDLEEAGETEVPLEAN